MTPRELLLNEFAMVSFSEIVTASGLSIDELNELIELGMFEPSGAQGAEPIFPARAIELARVARRLQIDFELPLAGVALALAYRERIRELEERLHRLECQVPGHTRD
jgi:chaperone modulatory protein CbpM